MKIGVDWKKEGDHSKRMNMEFDSMFEANGFFEKILDKETSGIILNIRMRKKNN